MDSLEFGEAFLPSVRIFPSNHSPSESEKLKPNRCHWKVDKIVA